MAKKSTAQKVFEIIDADPYVKQALRLGIANASSIARRIRKEHLPRATLQSIKAAVRRYPSEKKAFSYEQGLHKIKGKTKISLRSDLCVIRTLPGTKLNTEKISETAKGRVSMVKSANAVTIIAPQENAKEFKRVIRKPNIISSSEGLYEIMLSSPADIEGTPGFVAFVTEMLARNGVNIIEFYSCYTDTVFILERKQALRAYELLDRFMS